MLTVQHASRVRAGLRCWCALVAAATSVELVPHAPAAEAQATSVRASTPRATLVASVCDTSWSKPRELRTPRGQRLYVEAPTRVAGAAGPYLIGAPTFVWSDRFTFANAKSGSAGSAVGVKLLGESLATPLPDLPSATKPFTPIATREGHALLTLWATSSDTSRAAVFRLDTLWEASLTSNRWTKPRPIWSSGTLVWHPGAVSYVMGDSGVVVAFLTTDTARSLRRGVTVMWKTQGSWRRRWVSLGNAQPQALAAMTTSAAELLIAVVGSIDRPPLKASNAVYAIRLRWRDTASTPQFSLVREFQRAHAEDPNVFRTSQGLHVAWRQPDRRDFAHDSIAEAVSTDGGMSWTTGPATSLEGDMRGMRILPLAGTDAVAMALDAGTSKITTLRRRRAKWTLSGEEFSDARTIPMMTTENDRLRLWFGQTRSSAGSGGQYDAPVLVTASRALRCEATSVTPSRQRLRAPPRGKSTSR